MSANERPSRSRWAIIGLCALTIVLVIVAGLLSAHSGLVAGLWFGLILAVIGLLSALWTVVILVSGRRNAVKSRPVSMRLFSSWLTVTVFAIMIVLLATQLFARA